MKPTQILFGLGLCISLALGISDLSSTTEPETATGPLSAFAFMEGTWVSEKPEVKNDLGVVIRPSQRIEETWSSVADDALVGMLRWSRGGEVWLYELMAIELTASGPQMSLRHFSRGLKPWASEAKGALTWKLKSVSENEAVFVNEDIEDVHRVTYSRTGDALEVTLAGKDPKRRNTFEFQRRP